MRIINSNIPVAIEELLTYENPCIHGLKREEIVKGVEMLRANLKNEREDTPCTRNRLRWIETRHYLTAPLPRD